MHSSHVKREKAAASTAQGTMNRKGKKIIILILLRGTQAAIPKLDEIIIAA